MSDDEMNPGKAALILSKMLIYVERSRNVWFRDEDIEALTFAYSALQNVANQETPTSQDD